MASDWTFTLNGKSLPVPTGYKVDFEPFGEFSRNANGYLIGDLIGEKRKLNCTWQQLNGENYQLLLSARAPFFGEVTFYNPDSGNFETMEMYTSPVSATLKQYNQNQSKTLWGSVTMNIIER